MRYRMWFILLGVFVCQSCTHDFSLKEMGAESKAVLFCMPFTGSDTTLIQVARSRVIHRQEASTGGKPTLVFKLNGEEKAINYTETATELLPAQSYYVLGRLKEDDRIEMEVSYPDLPLAKAQTVIPKAFPLEKLEVVLTDGNYGRGIQFRVSFTDTAGTEDYYGMRVIKKKKTVYAIPEMRDTIQYMPVDLDLEKEPLLSEKTGFDEVFDISKEYYRYLYCWDDSKIDGKSYMLKVGTYYDPGYEGEEQKETIAYKIYLYKLSKEMYTYLQALNRIQNNDLGKYGLAPIRSHYTNVENGIGLLGGCNVYESDWISSPEEKK